MYISISERIKQEIRGNTRKEIQWSFHNGSEVTWGSEDKLVPEFTVRKLEEFSMNVCEKVLNHVYDTTRKMYSELKDNAIEPDSWDLGYIQALADILDYIGK